jgi:hypothetical protein
MVAPPGNQAANRENKLQPIATEGPGLLDVRTWHWFIVEKEGESQSLSG